MRQLIPLVLGITLGSLFAAGCGGSSTPTPSASSNATTTATMPATVPQLHLSSSDQFNFYLACQQAYIVRAAARHNDLHQVDKFFPQTVRFWMQVADPTAQSYAAALAAASSGLEDSKISAINKAAALCLANHVKVNG